MDRSILKKFDIIVLKKNVAEPIVVDRNLTFEKATSISSKYLLLSNIDDCTLVESGR